MTIGNAARIDTRRRLTPPAARPEATTQPGIARPPVETPSADELRALPRPTEARRELGRTLRSHEDQARRARLESMNAVRPLCSANTSAFRADGDGFRVTRRGGATQTERDQALPDSWGTKPASLETVRDPDDVNDDGTKAEQDAARANVEARAEDETAALDAMSQEQRDQYGAVAQSTEADPRARESLQTMLLDGDFDGADGAKLLDELHGLTQDELAEGIDRDELVSDLVQELEDPIAIAQEGKGTCVATSSEILLAQQQPAEYARLVRGLASPEGEVTLANGDTIRRELRTIDDDGSRRAITQRLLAPALMEYGNGADSYSNSTDLSYRREHKPMHGLNGQEAERLLEAMTGQSFRRQDAAANATDRAALAQDVLDAANAGQTVSTALSWSDGGGHRVLVTGGDDEWVTFINPWGREDRISREEFDQRVKSAAFLEPTLGYSRAATWV